MTMHKLADEQIEKLMRKSMSGEPITNNELMRLVQAQHLSMSASLRSTIDGFKTTMLEGLEKVFEQSREDRREAEKRAREDRREHQDFQTAEFRRLHDRMDKQDEGLREAITLIKDEAKEDRAALQAALSSIGRLQFFAYIFTLVVLAALGGAGVAVNAGWLSASTQM